jgi:hypothetical protein
MTILRPDASIPAPPKDKTRIDGGVEFTDEGSLGFENQQNKAGR